MKIFNSNTSFEQIIRNCQEENSSLYEEAWREFLSRYKKKIYQIIFLRCTSWHSARLNTQIKDIVNDIVSQVFITLPKAIKSFREVANERFFLLWIGTICSRTVSAYLKQGYVTDSLKWDDSAATIGELSIDNRWELFDFIKDALTVNDSFKRNKQRDLSIFLLYTWGNFSEKDIKKHGCFKELGSRVIEVCVSRNRNVLKEKLNKFTKRDI